MQWHFYSLKTTDCNNELMQERLIFHQGIIFCHRITCNKWFFQTCKKDPLTLMRLRGQALWGGKEVCGEKEVEEASPTSTSQKREGSSCRSLGGGRYLTELKSPTPDKGWESTEQSLICMGNFKENQEDNIFFTEKLQLLRSGRVWTPREQQPGQKNLPTSLLNAHPENK